MRLFWICFLAAGLSLSGRTQTKASNGDFTKSPTEHIINRLDKPFTVRSVEGKIIRAEGFREPLSEVLFEIERIGKHGKIRRVTTDSHGRFRISHLPPGKYEFKATLNGFQSVMGTIVVSKTATKGARIEIEMPTGV